jgi:hypothetical protein
MTQVIEATKGKIRDLPIQTALRNILENAGAKAGIDIVRVTSGGQAPKGSGGKRTGSTRHDNGAAADLQLEKGGKVLDFTIAADRAIIAKFVTAAASLGATGIGAATNYMGPRTLHIGFGSKAVWGAGGKAVNAPQWLKDAVLQGWNGPVASPAPAATLKRGDRGADVKAVQEKLFAFDGIFGAVTEGALKAFQTSKGLPATGTVDAATRKALKL